MDIYLTIVYLCLIQSHRGKAINTFFDELCLNESKLHGIVRTAGRTSMTGPKNVDYKETPRNVGLGF